MVKREEEKTIPLLEKTVKIDLMQVIKENKNEEKNIKGEG